MDDPADPTYTLSFDLLYKGLEITTGGQRIHQYVKLMEKIAQRGMRPGRHGALPVGIQIRHAATWWTWYRNGTSDHALIGEDNVREATLFPRDLSRLEP